MTTRNTRDDATEAWLARHLDQAPPLTAQQIELVRRTYGRVQLDPPTADALRRPDAA